MRSNSANNSISADGIDKLTRRLGQALPSITHVARYFAGSAHSNTVLSFSIAPNTHIPARRKLTCQYLLDVAAAKIEAMIQPDYVLTNLRRESVAFIQR